MTKDTNTKIRNDKRTILEIAIKQDIIKKLRPHLTQPSMGVSPQKSFEENGRKYSAAQEIRIQDATTRCP